MRREHPHTCTAAALCSNFQSLCALMKNQHLASHQPNELFFRFLLSLPTRACHIPSPTPSQSTLGLTCCHCPCSFVHLPFTLLSFYWLALKTNRHCLMYLFTSRAACALLQQLEEQ